MLPNNSGADRIYKILLIGESNVGKTSIILRYTENKFDPSGISTCGVDLKNKFVSLNNTKIRLDIWDTAGQERFRGLARFAQIGIDFGGKGLAAFHGDDAQFPEEFFVHTFLRSLF